MNRRELLTLAATGALAARAARGRPALARHSRFKAVAFDAFPIFDPRPIGALAESLFPGRGAALMDAWRARQFEYQWLRALGAQYVDFLRATQDSLHFAAKQLQLEIPPESEQQLLSLYSNLQMWPDAPAAIDSLHAAGVRLAFLSNMTRAMLETGLRRAGLQEKFEQVLSTDAVRTYKPDPRAYALGTDALRLKREEILFVAFAGWDVAGAKWFGYPTFWVNRMNAPAEELGATADASGPDLRSLVRFVSAA